MSAGLALVSAVSAGAQEATDPSPIEHALVEYLCRTVQRPAMIGTDAYQRCYTAQLALLRDPFGRNLASLTAADRKSIDAKCGDFQATRGRDAYLSCLNDQLVSIRDRRGLGKPAETALVVPQSAPMPPQFSSPLPLPAEPPASTAWWWIAGTLALAGSAGAAAFVVLKRRAVPQTHACRGCGAQLPSAGDLCPDCRHDAAEARRRAISERADEERLQEEQQRLDADQPAAGGHRRGLAQEEPVRAREEASSEFDPYVILGVDSDATADRIQDAYEAAKARYDPREYEHLGIELQDYFRAKAAAVERAYLMLALPE